MKRALLVILLIALAGANIKLFTLWRAEAQRAEYAETVAVAVILYCKRPQRTEWVSEPLSP